MNKEDLEFEKLIDEVKTQREEFKRKCENRFLSPGVYTIEKDISIFPYPQQTTTEDYES